jgi:hypothetical protein
MNSFRGCFYKQTYTILLLLLLISYTSVSFAFYEWQGKQVYVEARALIRGFASTYQYPESNTLSADTTSSGMGAISRIIVDGGIGERWNVEFNAYQTYISYDLLNTQLNTGLPLTVERSALFEQRFNNNDFVHLALDRFALRWRYEDLNITIGRQAINLANTFYFTPNDFFSPFVAQSFFRVYKSGVDALRAELSVNEFSQLSLISVLGYKTKTDSDTGWSHKPDSHRTSHLIRWSNAYGNIDGSLILGHIIDKNIIGIGLQGELYDWIGIRMEGHYAKPNESNLDSYQQLSIGIEHRWENTLELRLELFYNGLGRKKVSNYQILQKKDDN